MKRLKKILKWTGIVLGALVAIGLVANAWFVWTTDRRLERQLAAIRAAGEPLTLADLARKPIPPEQNAATYLRQAKAGVDAIYKEIWEHFKGGSKHIEWERFEAEDPMSAKTQKTVKAIFAAYPNVIPLLQQASACPDYDAQLDYTLSPEQCLEKWLPGVDEIRSASRVPVWRARLLVAEGNYDEALRTALILFRLTRHCTRNPAVFGYVVAATVRRIAVDSANLVLQAGPVSTEVREALDAELARQDSPDGFARVLKSERAFGLDCFRNSPFRNVWLFNRGRLNQWESKYLGIIEGFVELSGDQGSYRQAHQMIREINERVSPTQGFPAASLFSAIEMAYNATLRTRADVRSLRLLNALQTHVPAGSDKVPKLSELGLPAETTIDPFNGEPLHVKRLPQGWLVYSVGRDLKDDGGDLEHYRDVGVGPPHPTHR